MKKLSLYFLLFLTIALPILAPQAPETPSTVIVLAPYADPKNPGRTINGTFERGIALQFAERLSTELMARIPEAQVIIIKPNENTSPLQAASYANRLQPALVLGLSFYQESSPQPQIALYRYTNESDLPLQRTELALYPHDQAYRLYTIESKNFLQNLFDSLQATQGLHCQIPNALPIKSLLGIASPACSIEMGLPHDYAWQILVEPVAESIVHTLTR
jgi:hypothetical protein